MLGVTGARGQLGQQHNTGVQVLAEQMIGEEGQLLPGKQQQLPPSRLARRLAGGQTIVGRPIGSGAINNCLEYASHVHIGTLCTLIDRLMNMKLQ